jgi:hypothetical protein
VSFITGVATILTQVCTASPPRLAPQQTDAVGCDFCVVAHVQFHSNYVAQFMKLVGEFVRFTYGLPPREKERYPSAETTLLFADTLCRLGNISRSHLDGERHVFLHVAFCLFARRTAAYSDLLNRCPFVIVAEHVPKHLLDTVTR